MRRPIILTAVLAVLAAACTAGSAIEPNPVAVEPVQQTSETLPAEPTPAASSVSPPTTVPATTTTVSPFARPDWLGTRVLPFGPDGENGIVLPTPIELQGRRLLTISGWEPPVVPGVFESTIDPVPTEVLARSSWTDECPVAVDDLRFLTMSHYGFDGQYHTGEMIVNAAIADDVVGVFRRLHDAQFPIEDMRVTTAEDIDAPPTGDTNRTASFECRPGVGSTNWSQHAFGLAVDINRFHNPYIKGELVLPELASYYLDRTLDEPGMIIEDGVAHQAFTELGWGWGGNWNTLKDYMHFSRNGH